jgi:TPR repeat protein
MINIARYDDALLKNAERQAKEGNIEAKFCVVLLLLFELDVEKALPLCLECANDGFAPAMCIIALIYLKDFIECEDPIRMAYYWLKKAEEHGLPIAKKMLSDFQEISTEIENSHLEFFKQLYEITEVVERRRYTDNSIQ